VPVVRGGQSLGDARTGVATGGERRTTSFERVAVLADGERHAERAVVPGRVAHRERDLLAIDGLADPVGAEGARAAAVGRDRRLAVARRSVGVADGTDLSAHARLLAQV
jgi:hypothetical protein